MLRSSLLLHVWAVGVEVVAVWSVGNRNWYADVEEYVGAGDAGGGHGGDAGGGRVWKCRR